MVLENGHKYYKKPSKYVEQPDRTVEYLDGSQQEDSYEVTKELKTSQQPVNRYQVKRPPRVAFATPTVLKIDDIVEKVKQRLLQQILDKRVDVNAQANPQAGSAQTGDSLVYKYFPKKSFKVTEVENPVIKPVPMTVIKEEVLYEATYEDTLDKDLQPQIQYSGQMSLKKNRLVNTQYEEGVKKVRIVKQVLVPANSNQGQSTYVDQTSIMKQLALMQQQIEQLNRTEQQKELKNKRPIRPTSLTVLEDPQLNIEAVEAKFEIVPNPTADVQKTNDGNEDHVELSKEESEESVLSEQTTAEPVVTEPSTKALTVPGTVENEQFTEENEVVLDTDETVQNDDEPIKQAKESVSNEEKDIKPDPKTGKDTKLDANAKVHTQEFGNPNAGEPIVAKTYNFDEPNEEAGTPVNLNLPVDSARKVLLF